MQQLTMRENTLVVAGPRRAGSSLIITSPKADAECNPGNINCHAIQTPDVWRLAPVTATQTLADALTRL